ncbi:MAG: glucokinase [Pseudomonadota bacterium]
MSAPHLLIGDIGGTHARFAWADPTDNEFGAEKKLLCADFDTIDAAIEHFLASSDVKAPDTICLAVAGPIVGDEVRFTNNDWIISSSALAADFGIDAVRILNDFEAIGYSIPMLGADDSMPIGLAEATDLGREEHRVAVLGPGTGLGMVGVNIRDGEAIPIRSEGGHVGFSPETQVQLEIMSVLREQFDRVSAERLVSGPGLENIYRALTTIHGDQRPALSAPEIFSRANSNTESRSAEAVHVFFEVLGQVAGDFALSISADDGVYVAGGIAQRYPVMMSNSAFRSGFENKGRYRSLMERIPTQLILHEHPGLLGASHCARQLLAA